MRFTMRSRLSRSLAGFDMVFVVGRSSLGFWALGYFHAAGTMAWLTTKTNDQRPVLPSFSQSFSRTLRLEKSASHKCPAYARDRDQFPRLRPGARLRQS